MSSENGHSNSPEVGSRKLARGLPKESAPRADNAALDFQETVSLRERMALYKAAVSERESTNAFAHTSEKIKFCTVPGGLAAVRKQFEKVQKTSSQKAFAQYQQLHKSVQETSSSTQHTLSSSSREAECNEMTSKESQIEASQTQVVSHREQVIQELKMASTFTQHTDETVTDAAQNEELPKTVTQILKQQIERTAQEKAVHPNREPVTPAKEVKKLHIQENEMCRLCQQRVYPMECLVADKQHFHKSCFRCHHCGSQLSSLSEKEAKNICTAKKNEVGNKGKDGEVGNVQDKLNKAGGSQNKEESGKDINEGDNVITHSDGKQQETKINETDDSEVVQVTNIDDITVQKNHSEFRLNSNNNNNYATCSHPNICRQETTLSATSKPTTAFSHAICTRSQHAFTVLEYRSGNEEIFEMYEPHESDSSNPVTVPWDKQNSEDEDAVTSNSLA
ncbi:xin actin-binding repeat-containing protein 2 isoform B [Patagioenas fasciata monilis]|uniref:Xin actin-binding repeat-containing protein 2 isoform B n=1 Tax=Patagioenas fasciata monilis TaxID=372326 RepID=A0A1V4K7Y4_PATFA|nr:xin actin-binding repeat-containing protein 2 isoform B [Patagioenas fasciata monilis]